MSRTPRYQLDRNLQDEVPSDLFNSPANYQALARAIRTGTAKVVIIGDSLLYGLEGPAENTMVQHFARWLRNTWPTVTWTVINRSIPGAKLTDFLNASYTPAGGWAALGSIPGGAAWSPATDEEHSLRWPEGALNVATAWKTVVSNDAPDLIIMPMGFNDIIGGARTMYQYRVDLLSFFTYVAALTKVPSILFCTTHTGNSTNGATDGYEHRKLQGLNQLIRAATLNGANGLLDAGRAFDRIMFGADPLKLKWDADRYLDSITNTDLWQYNFSPLDWTSNPIANAGSSTVAIDSTGNHAGATTTLWSRKKLVMGLSCRFQLRKLATNNDRFFVMLSSQAPDADPLSSTDKLFVQFRNSGANGVVDLIMDGNTLFTANTALFSTDDTSGISVVVAYDGYKVRIWLTPNVNPHTPDITWSAVAHAPGYGGVGYYNLVGAPAVKATGIVFMLGSQYPLTTSQESIADFFGGPYGSYLTTNRPQGGDTASHPSTMGYESIYLSALQPVAYAIRQAVTDYNAVARFANGSALLLLGCHISGANYIADATEAVVVLVNTGTAQLEFYKNSGLTVNAAFNPLLRAAIGGNSAATLGSVLQLADTAGTLRAGFVTFSGGPSGVALGCHHNGSAYVADATTAIILYDNTSTAALEVYINTGLTAGNTFSPTKRFTARTTGLDLPAGSATAGTSPLKYTSGTINTTAEVGAQEYNGRHYETGTGLLRYVKGGTIWNDFANVANVGTTETALRSKTIAAGGLAVNGDAIDAWEDISIANTVATKQIKVKFGPSGSETTIFDSGALAGSAASEAKLDIKIVRVSSSVVRCSVSATLLVAISPQYTEITGLTLANAMSLLITAQSGAGGANSDSIARVGRGIFRGGI